VKRITTLSTATILFVLCSVGPATLAGQKKMAPSAEHKAAVAKCTTGYNEAVKEAKMKKGKERTDALAAAKKSRADCVTAAPQ
jgi:hypothetical protein